MSSSVKVGDLLAGKYRVERVLGEGAMGIVVAALHVELNKPVAVKLMKLDVMPGKDGIERFMREARAAARLQTEHVCHVHDVGRLEDGAPFIVMEMLEGTDLASVLAQARVLPQHVVARYMLQVCEAMAEAHAAGIVHRDLKPQNLFVTRTKVGTEKLKVLDFGVSKVHAAGDNLRTRTATVMGTPAYMSPEQLASSKDVDGRADIWSLGVILYELSTGRLPFNAEDFLALAIQIAQQAPMEPRMLAPSLDPMFEAVILRCLEKDRTRRYADVIELVNALRPFASDASLAASNSALALAATAASGTTQPPMVPTTAPPPVSRTTLGAAASQIDAQPRRSSSTWIAGAAVAVVAIAVLAIVIVTRKGSHEAERPASPGVTSPSPPPDDKKEKVEEKVKDKPVERPVEVAKPSATTPEPAPPKVADPPAKPPDASKPKPAEPPKRETVMKVDRIEAGTVNADTMRVNKIKADEIEAKRIEAERIKAEKIKADEIKAKKIEVRDEDVFKK